MSDQIRLAVLGCGTIVRGEHLPAILRHPQVRLAALADASEERAAKLVRNASLECRVCTDYRSIWGDADAVLNALPNHLHASVTLEAIEAGVHVLCEKPLAIRSEDARACGNAAQKRGLVLAVGMNRRFQHNYELLKAVLEEGALGALQDYDWQMGGPFDWNSASGFYFSRAQAGGGVLLDYGVHLLDSLVAWFGPVSELACEDDDWGSGIEANVRLSLKHDGPYGLISGSVRLSRTYALNNRLLVRGTEACAELPVETPDSIVLHRSLHGMAVNETLAFSTEKHVSGTSFDRQLENFIRSIRGIERPRIDAAQAAYVLEVIERCYAKRTRLPEPWSEVPAGIEVGA
ncbi:MAG TPA: Gfo/Idh/MocA family oxidoreductase [Dongiaceae bacterium]|nr:Gfo/Idh/MocA family oxidoreductase [Dongiaceae bacterium]